MQTMKTYLVALLFSLIFSVNISAQSSVNKIVSQMKKTEQYQGVSLPGWIIRLGLKLVDESEMSNAGLVSIANKVKHLRVATTTLDIGKYNTKAIVNNFVKGLRDNDQFEEYVSVRSEDQNLKILVQEDEEIIKNLLILSEDGGDIALVHLSTHLTTNDLRNISFSQVKKETGSVSNRPDNNNYKD